MTIEDDVLTLMQGVIIVAGPVLFCSTITLWRGMLAGGKAKSQAWIAFYSDPITLFAVIACVCVMICFWTYTLVFRHFEPG
ncbi:MAG: hypothetical protein ACFFE1_16715 [Candidatus Thorarchaeota archaeon]